jgi:hypothetical protein
MGHPEVENETPFTFEPLFLAEEEGRPLLVPVLKATYDIKATGLALAEDQLPLNLAGEPYGKPGESSYRYEPECAWPKLATDVVLVGSAVAPRPGTTEMVVGFQVGRLQKAVRVLGDRAFYKSLGSVEMTKPVPFERVPLQWERAFGGWDRSNPDQAKHSVEPRNPVGVGFRGSGTRFEEGLRCPNLEDPAQALKGWGHRVTPMGFGFISPNWEPRTKFAGTYDAVWERTRKPLLPKDFDRRFFTAASAGLAGPGFLRGDETVTASGVTRAGAVSFRLPGAVELRVEVQRPNQADSPVPLALDTVVVDTDAAKVFLFWRGQLVLRREPLEVRAMRVRSAALPGGAAVRRS